MDLLHPKQIKLTPHGGKEKTFVISKFPAVQGREIICKYPISALPKLGDYNVNEETMLKLMCFVGVVVDGKTIPLDSRDLVDNHVPDWQVLMKLEWATLEYNVSFFELAANPNFLKGLGEKYRPLISKILTDLSALSSQKDEPPSTN